jgi:hypothetical protein
MESWRHFYANSLAVAARVQRSPDDLLNSTVDSGSRLEGQKWLPTQERSRSLTAIFKVSSPNWVFVLANTEFNINLSLGVNFRSGFAVSLKVVGKNWLAYASTSWRILFFLQTHQIGNNYPRVHQSHPSDESPLEKMMTEHF